MYIYHIYIHTSVHTFAWRVHFVSTKKRNTKKKWIILQAYSTNFEGEPNISTCTVLTYKHSHLKHTHTHLRLNEYRVGTSLWAFCTLQIYVCMRVYACKYVCLYAVSCACVAAVLSVFCVHVHCWPKYWARQNVYIKERNILFTAMYFIRYSNFPKLNTHTAIHTYTGILCRCWLIYSLLLFFLLQHFLNVQCYPQLADTEHNSHNVNVGQ